jgi:hypothetical protein
MKSGYEIAGGINRVHLHFLKEVAPIYRVLRTSILPDNAFYY